jgi:hypothetical protein
MINEANEPSSACRLWRILLVETSTPPKTTPYYRRFERLGQGWRSGAALICNALHSRWFRDWFWKFGELGINAGDDFVPGTRGGICTVAKNGCRHFLCCPFG